MLKHLLTIEGSFHLRGRGVIVAPHLAAQFIDQLKEKSFTGVLVFADGRRQEVKGSFSLTHYHIKRDPTVEFPTWGTTCLLEEAVGSVPKGTELWWNKPE